jgi:hypothetical protein
MVGSESQDVAVLFFTGAESDESLLWVSHDVTKIFKNAHWLQDRDAFWNVPSPEKEIYDLSKHKGGGRRGQEGKFVGGEKGRGLGPEGRSLEKGANADQLLRGLCLIWVGLRQPHKGSGFNLRTVILGLFKISRGIAYEVGTAFTPVLIHMSVC